MDMENLRKELQKREHREILAKNFGPEETNERTRLQESMKLMKKETIKRDLDAQISKNKEKTLDYRKAEIHGDLHQLAVQYDKYNKEAMDSKYRKQSEQ